MYTTPMLTKITANCGIALGDNDKATFGAGDDLQIYHNGGSGNYIDSVNKDLYIRCNLDAGVVGGDILLQPKAGENSAVFRDNGAVELYHDNALKLATSSSGVTVTGTVAATSYTGDGSNLTGVGSTTAGAVGTYVFARIYTTSFKSFGAIISASEVSNTFPAGLKPAGTTDSAGSISGSWRLMGRIDNNPTTTLFVRIS